MIIYPAIDLVEGQCVRLHKGDFDQQTTYAQSPLDVAKSYKAAGAQWLHAVDLDGAKNPDDRQTALIKEIIEKSDLCVQTGGGIRNIDDVRTLIDAGAHRVVIGSLAITDPRETKKIISIFGAGHICLAADVITKDGTYKIAVSGWQESSTVSLDDFLASYQELGIKHILCTDISKDGTMQGCNFNLYRDLKEKFPDLSIQASGGVHALSDLENLTGDVEGVIIGKALYENAFTLREALSINKPQKQNRHRPPAP